MIPDYHDKPTEPGLWVHVFDDGVTGCYRVSAKDIGVEFWPNNCRFYGPIPPDNASGVGMMYTKAEIERAARILCEQEGLDPAETFTSNFIKIGGSPYSATWLDSYKQDISVYLRVDANIEATLKLARAAGVTPDTAKV